MNVHIGLSAKRVIITIFISFFILLGLKMFIVGTVNTLGIKYSKDMKSLELSELKKGIYLYGEISYVLGKYYNQPGGGIGFLTSMAEWWNGPEEYAIPLNDRQYITIYAEKPYFEVFEKFTDVPSVENAYFFYGKTVSTRTELNYRFLEPALHVEGKEAVHKRISKDYAIQILEPEEEKDRMIHGLLIFIAGMILLYVFIKDWIICLSNSVC